MSSQKPLYPGKKFPPLSGPSGSQRGFYRKFSQVGKKVTSRVGGKWKKESRGSGQRLRIGGIEARPVPWKHLLFAGVFLLSSHKVQLTWESHD